MTHRIYKERTVTVHGVEGRGPTVAAAKADAISQIEWLAVAAPHTEVRFGYVLCAWPYGHGWQTAVFWPEEKEGQEIYSGMTTGRETRWQIIMDLRVAALQRAWSPACDDSALLTAASLDDYHADSARRWIQFQRDYLAGKRPHLGPTPAAA